MDAGLTAQEKETVIREESKLRAYREIQGELLDENLIEQLKATMLLAVRDRTDVNRFFELLEKECNLYNFLDVYQAGKDCFASNETIERGFKDYLLQLSTAPEHQAFYKEFGEVFRAVIQQMPDAETKLCPEFLKVVYRDTHNINAYLDKFFAMGYEIQQKKRRGA